MEASLLTPILRRLPRAWNNWAYATIGTSLFGLAAGGAAALLPGPPWISWATAGCFGLAYLSFWIISIRTPRTRRKFIGIAVGILADDEAEDRRVRADFLHEFRRLITDGPGAGVLQLLELSQWTVADMLEDEGTREAVFKGTGASFALFGRARRRQGRGGKELHVLDLSAAVRHRMVDDAVRDRLFGEFGNVVPRRWELSVESDYLEFEATAAWLDIATRYYVSLARLLLLDFVGAHSLLDEVERRIAGLQAAPKGPHLALRRRLPRTRLDLLDAERAWCSRRFYETGDDQFLAQAEDVCKRVHRLEPNNYSANLTRAAAAFLLRRDIAFAEQTIQRCAGHPQPEWRYSRAFLLAYRGRYSEARHEYQRACRQPGGEQILPLLIEQAIDRVAAEEPNHPGPRFASGVVNLLLKGDPVVARRELRAFLALEDDIDAHTRSWVEEAVRRCEGQDAPEAA